MQRELGQSQASLIQALVFPSHSVTLGKSLHMSGHLHDLLCKMGRVPFARSGGGLLQQDYLRRLFPDAEWR